MGYSFKNEQLEMHSRFKSLFHIIIVLAGLMISSDLLACAPEDTLQEDTISLISNIQEDLKYSEKSSEESRHNTSSHHDHSTENSESHHECDCCEFCRCTSCSGCSSVGGSVLFPDSDNQNIESNVTNRVVLLEPSYISFLTSPPEHPPK